MRDDNNPYLAYSPRPGISIENSSEPFRAFLGALLSVVKDVPVESSAYNPTILLDTIEEEQDDGPLPEYDIDDRPGEHQGSSGITYPRHASPYPPLVPMYSICDRLIGTCITPDYFADIDNPGNGMHPNLRYRGCGGKSGNDRHCFVFAIKEADIPSPEIAVAS